ncbi:Abi family protein [Pseudomonas sp. Ant30-3]|uniref:Abi family protein n=1 Tax=Pseudomonas sp. Ant30-3 TaxID=1488328 RepID=UPI001F2E43E8|nr:Abi family protein [Pseudomonas sp. Ant30-3]
MLQQLAPPKPFRSYRELSALLIKRGMRITDVVRAERKLSQVGYYRLSGFWYPCREFLRDADDNVVICNVSKKPLRQNIFTPGTYFDAAFEIYLFDKKLRQLMLDAIERIEVHVRSVIAHEVGYHDPLAYQSSRFINPSQTRMFSNKQGRQRNIWNEWLNRQSEQIGRSGDDSIEWHRLHSKAMPFWVVVEAWDFGTASKYFEILKDLHRNRISQRLGLKNAKVLKEWLQEINTLRNRCAHHCRIWNQVSTNPLPTVPENPYFQRLALDANARTRLYGLIAVIWYLVKGIGANSQWISQVADVIDSKPEVPGCPFSALGLPTEAGFPRQMFSI